MPVKASAASAETALKQMWVSLNRMKDLQSEACRRVPSPRVSVFGTSQTIGIAHLVLSVDSPGAGVESYRRGHPRAQRDNVIQPQREELEPRAARYPARTFPRYPIR